MDFFELLPDSPPPKKKQKVDELGVGLSTDVREESVEKEHGTPEKVQRISTARKWSGNRFKKKLSTARMASRSC